MGNRTFVHSRRVSNFIDGWRRCYCLVIPVVCTLIYIWFSYKADQKVWMSKNFPDILSSIITFVSIAISLFGVLLTLLISEKGKSEMIQFFLDSADKKVFIKSLKRLIMSGLLTVIVSVCLFAEDIINDKWMLFLSSIAIFTLIKFMALTYRFTNILLDLFIKDKEEYRKKEGPALEPEKKKELQERIKKGI